MNANVQHDDDAEIAEIAVHVSGIRRVRGRGNVVYEADAEIDINGIVVKLWNVTVRDEPHNRRGAYLPQSRDQNGVRRPAVAFPAAVERAIAGGSHQRFNSRVGALLTLPPPAP